MDTKFVWFNNSNRFYLKFEIFKKCRDLFLVEKSTGKSYLVLSINWDNSGYNNDLYSKVLSITDFNYFINNFDLDKVLTNFFGDNENEKK